MNSELSDSDQLSTSSEQTEQLKESMIESLAKSGNISKSVRAVGIGRTSHYDWCKADSDYKSKVDVALSLARESRIDALEDAIMDQALGVWCEYTNQWITRPNPVSQIFALKSISRQQAMKGDDSRLWSDAPPPDDKPEDKEREAKALNAPSGSEIANMLNNFISTVKRTEQANEAIDAQLPIDPPTKSTDDNTK